MRPARRGRNASAGLHRLCGGQPLDVISSLTGLESDIVEVLPGLEQVALLCYNTLADVVYAELDHIASGDSTPNDPYFASNQYGPKKIKADLASVTFTVTNVVLSGSTYTATTNHDPESDSNGSRIIVSRP